jgi:ankyrin repeat protein
MYAASGVDREYAVDAIPLLLSKGSRLDRRDNTGKTALDIAKDQKHKYAVELLTSSK